MKFTFFFFFLHFPSASTWLVTIWFSFQHINKTRLDGEQKKLKTPADAEFLMSGSDKVPVIEDAETNDSGPMHCEYIPIGHLPNTAFPLQVKESAW